MTKKTEKSKSFQVKSTDIILKIPFCELYGFCAQLSIVSSSLYYFKKNANKKKTSSLLYLISAPFPFFLYFWVLVIFASFHLLFFFARPTPKYLCGKKEEKRKGTAGERSRRMLCHNQTLNGYFLKNSWPYNSNIPKKRKPNRHKIGIHFR